jgi:hypothetical protein
LKKTILKKRHALTFIEYSEPSPAGKKMNKIPSTP